MKPPHRLRRSLLAPPIYLAALLLLLEDWLWELGARLTAGWACWPPLRRLEARVCALGPRAALAVFALPATLLFPVKLLALLAMAHGHALLGLLVIVLAKLLGAALVARLYLLTRPVLMTIAWFARLLLWFLALKARCIARLRASAAWRDAAALAARLALWRRAGRRHGLTARLARLLRRLRSRWRARRR